LAKKKIVALFQSASHEIVSKDWLVTKQSWVRKKVTLKKQVPSTTSVK